ncbi:MAG: sporulation integral membrane protein YtvI [Cellulosilyticum sp.]|nr:sporulation integral membrane protein YtvI [Cellulosilyticum sp.]
MIEDKIESWYKRIGKKIGVFLLVIVAIYVILRLHIIGLFAPFIVAWIFASLLNPVVTWAYQKFKVPRGIGTILSMLSILSGLLAIIYIVVQKLWEQIVNFTKMLPEISDEMIHQLNHIELNLGDRLQLIPGAYALTNLDGIIEKVIESLSSFLTSVIPTIYGGISKVPDIILFTIVMFLATFFMTRDFYNIKAFVKAQFSDTIIDKIVIMQRGVVGAIGGYVRTQLILMSITFCICLVGLFLFGIEYALLLSVIIAIIDAFPVFGSGTILIPWAVYNLIVGHYSIGLGLLGIYGIIFVTRQIMEPRILASQIGVYALVTVMAVYIGYKTIGFFGLIVGPALVVVLQMLQNVGALPKFKPVKKPEYEGEYNEKHTSNRNNKRS